MTSIFGRREYLVTEGVENRVGDDGVRAILQYRPSDSNNCAKVTSGFLPLCLPLPLLCIVVRASVFEFSHCPPSARCHYSSFDGVPVFTIFVVALFNHILARRLDPIFIGVYLLTFR